MKKQVKEQWVAALRSREYRQGQGALHVVSDEGDRFCCLGVLCDLAVKAGVEVRLGSGVIILDGIRYNTVRYDNEGAYPPVSVQEWSDLERRERVVSREAMTRLASLNDSGRTFEEIADYIEEHL
jgi:hypothetical protein